MKKLGNEELMTEFHERMSSKFPDISLKQGKEICNGPWRFLAEEMKSGELEEVRLKYFGTFQVYIGRAKHMFTGLKERFRFNKINKNDYFRIKDMLEKFIKKNEND